jgi:hypothetical protein
MRDMEDSIYQFTIFSKYDKEPIVTYAMEIPEGMALGINEDALGNIVCIKEYHSVEEG